MPLNYMKIALKCSKSNQFYKTIAKFDENHTLFIKSIEITIAKPPKFILAINIIFVIPLSMCPVQP